MHCVLIFTNLISSHTITRHSSVSGPRARARHPPRGPAPRRGASAWRPTASGRRAVSAAARTVDSAARLPVPSNGSRVRAALEQLGRRGVRSAAQERRVPCAAVARHGGIASAPSSRAGNLCADTRGSGGHSSSRSGLHEACSGVFTVAAWYCQKTFESLLVANPVVSPPQHTKSRTPEKGIDE